MLVPFKSTNCSNFKLFFSRCCLSNHCQ